MDECIICNESGGGLQSIASQKSLETIQSFCKDWTKIGKNLDILNRVKDLTYSNDTKRMYHRKCYQTLCHKGNLVRAQKKYEEDLASASETKKRGKTNIETSCKRRKTFDKELCVFCQSNENTVVHSVSSSDMGKKFLAIKESTKNNEVASRLAFIFNEKDAFAQNMKYHINCLRKETRGLYSSSSTPDSCLEK